MTKKYKCLADKNTVDENGGEIKDCCRQDTCCKFCGYEDCHEGCLNANNHNCSETCKFCTEIIDGKDYLRDCERTGY